MGVGNQTWFSARAGRTLKWGTISQPHGEFFTLKTGRPCKVSLEQLDRSAHVHGSVSHSLICIRILLVLRRAPSWLLQFSTKAWKPHCSTVSVQASFAYFLAVWVKHRVCLGRAASIVYLYSAFQEFVVVASCYFLIFITNNRHIYWFDQFVDISFVLVSEAKYVCMGYIYRFKCLIITPKD